MKTNRTRSIINNKITIGRQTVNEPITQTTLNIFFFIPSIIYSEKASGTLLYEPYTGVYAAPTGGRVFAPFRSENEYRLWSVIGYAGLRQRMEPSVVSVPNE